MKRPHDDGHERHQDDGDDCHDGRALLLPVQLQATKVARIGPVEYCSDATKVGNHMDSAPIDILTDDILYHLFNSTSERGVPLFPPECRWVPAFVCRRWRDVVISITRADASILTNCLRDALWDAPPPKKAHHNVVRASGMALMIQHGLPTEAVGAWIARNLDPVDVAAVLMASAVPDRVNEAILLAEQVPRARLEWERHINRLRLWHGKFGSTEQCNHSWPRVTVRHALVAAASGSWQDIDMLVSMARAHGPCCVGIAALHAARRGRIDAVRALLGAMPTGTHEDRMRTIHNALSSMWLLVGRHALLPLADFLLDLEQGHENVLCLGPDERQEIACVRIDSGHDISWNWLAEAVEHNHISCLDFCKRHGLTDRVPTIAVGVAALAQHIEFYGRVRADTSSLIGAVSRAVRWDQPMQRHALSWIVSQPEFDLFSDYPRSHCQLDQLFDYARDQNVGDVEILRAAVIVMQRWPNIYQLRRELPRNRYDRKDPNAIEIWKEAADRLGVVLRADDGSTAVHQDAKAFLARHTA